MSLLIDLAGGVIKAVGGARTASRTAGLDMPVLEELHDGLSPVRAEFHHARAHNLATNGGACQAGQSADSADTGDGDLANTGDGFISDIIEWFTDLFS